jgi:O-antigen ligase
MTVLFQNIWAVKDVDDKTERLRFFLILLYVFSLPFDMFFSSTIFLTLGVATLIDLSVKKLKQIPKQVWLFQSVYFISVAGYFYSYNKHEAGFILERQLSILLFPLVLPLAININKSRVDAIITSLVFSACWASMMLFFHVFYVIFIKMHLPFLSTVMSGAFFNHQFSKPIGIHAGYLALYVSFSLIYVIQLFKTVHPIAIRSKINYLTLSLISLLLLAALIFLASRNAFLSTLFILVIIYPLYITKNKSKYLVIVSFCLVGCFLLLYNVPYLRQRFSSELISDIKSLPDGTYINYSHTDPRIERWEAAMELVKKSWLVGYGTGDEVTMLKTEYSKRGMFISYLEAFNAHNQYLSILLKNGIIGLLLFLFVFAYYFYQAFKSGDFMYMAFLVLLMIGFYTENILDANKGIVFFAFFNTIFGYNAIKSLHGSKRSAG